VAEPLNRRDFLARGSLLPLGAALGVGLGFGEVAPSAAAQSPIKRAGGARLKTSLNAYSFSKALNDQLKGQAGGISLFGLLEFCAELNLDGIDPTGYFFPGYPKVPGDKYLNDFKRRAFQLGVDISGTGVRNNFAAPDKAARAADVRHVKEWIECATRMGAPVIRVFAGAEPGGYTFDQVAGWMADDLRACVEHGEKYGVLVGVQNHGDTLKTADQVLKVVKMVDSEWFGVIVDTGYFLTPDPYEEIARVMPYAVNWQIKEKVAGGARVDLNKLVRVIRAGGYRGYLPVETLPAKGEDYDPKARVTQLVKELRTAMRETE
jgi:sugar phosphate isomerase/epimerase